MNQQRSTSKPGDEEEAIRKFRPGDLEEVLKIEERSFPAEPYPTGMFLYLYRRCGDSFLVAERRNEVVAYAVLCREGSKGHLVSMAVHPDHRREAIGSALLKNLMEFAKNHEINRVYLEVRASNEDAKKFYKHEGYTAVGNKENYYSDGTDAQVMEKRP